MSLSIWIQKENIFRRVVSLFLKLHRLRLYRALQIEKKHFPFNKRIILKPRVYSHEMIKYQKLWKFNGTNGFVVTWVSYEIYFNFPFAICRFIIITAKFCNDSIGRHNNGLIDRVDLVALEFPFFSKPSFSSQFSLHKPFIFEIEKERT